MWLGFLEEPTYLQQKRGSDCWNSPPISDWEVFPVSDHLSRSENNRRLGAQMSIALCLSREFASR